MIRRVIVVGSFVVGMTVRLPRLPLPGETLPADAFDLGPGGKGTNLAGGVARLGGHVDFIGKVGNDEFGAMAEQLLHREGIGADRLYRTDTAATGVGLVYLDGRTGENTIGLHLGANLDLTADETTTAIESFPDAPVITAQLEVSDEVVDAAFSAAGKRGMRCLLNPAPARVLPTEILEKTDIITPNINELFQLLERDVPGNPTNGEILDAAGELSRRGPSTVIVTLGARGALLLDSGDGAAGDSAHWIEPLETQAVDTVGAGDAFNAGVAWALAGGSDLLEAVRIGTVCGALATRKIGVFDALPTRAEMETSLELYRSRR